ncbi:MAG: hypothetical protein HGA76_09270 [Candidatus Firestonebacteria bacterium]|nr:hypothetical protein [Candidatus Firestonebacteria bacterium]
MKLTKLTVPTVTQAFGSLRKLGLVRELTGQQRNKMFGYTQYLNLLNEGTKV